jgi:hypothetical protein
LGRLTPASEFGRVTAEEIDMANQGMNQHGQTRQQQQAGSTHQQPNKGMKGNGQGGQSGQKQNGQNMQRGKDSSR